jgi:myosin heavy subunit
MKALRWFVLGLLAAVGAYLYLLNQQLAREAAGLRAENQQLQEAKAAAEEAVEAASRTQSEELARLRQDNQELLKLRNEVRQLREDKQTLSRQVQTVQSQAQDAQAQVQNAQAQLQALQATAAGTATAPGPVRGLFTQAQLTALQQRGVTMDANAAFLACLNNLRSLDGALQQWALENRKPAGSAVTLNDLAPYLRNQTPACPAGGTYNLSTVGARPTCTVPGHVLP